VTHLGEYGRCPACASPINGHANADGARCGPKPGDLSVCLYCTSFLQFEDSGVRELKPADLEQLEPEARMAINLVRDAVLRVHAQAAPPPRLRS
jgi:hypothetical protein